MNFRYYILCTTSAVLLSSCSGYGLNGSGRGNFSDGDLEVVIRDVVPGPIQSNPNPGTGSGDAIVSDGGEVIIAESGTPAVDSGQMPSPPPPSEIIISASPPPPPPAQIAPVIIDEGGVLMPTPPVIIDEGGALMPPSEVVVGSTENSESEDSEEVEIIEVPKVEVITGESSGSEFCKKDEKENDDKNGNNKILICHRTDGHKGAGVEILVSRASWDASHSTHHDDNIGACANGCNKKSSSLFAIFGRDNERDREDDEEKIKKSSFEKCENDDQDTNEKDDDDNKKGKK